jgi:hypothetical protein
MADKPGKYWDYDECRWVTCPVPAEQPRVPEQADPVEPEPEADVRSR